MNLDFLNSVEELEHKASKAYLKAVKEKDIKHKLKLLKKALNEHYKLKDFCIKCGHFDYYAEMYEKCHNARNACFSFTDKIRSEIDDIEKNMSKYLMAQQIEKLRDEFIEKKKDEILSLIQNNDGILQKGLKLSYDKIYSPAIDTILYLLVKEDKIRKEKQGNSNKLFIK